LDRIVWQGQQSALASSSFIEGISFGLALVVSIILFPKSSLWWVQAIALGVAALMVSYGYYHGQATTYSILEKGISKECHYINDQYHELPFDKTLEIIVIQNAWARNLNIGTLVFKSNSISFQNIRFDGIKDPKKVRRIALDAKISFELTTKKQVEP
jgi:hypothetical protein